MRFFKKNPTAIACRPVYEQLSLSKKEYLLTVQPLLEKANPDNQTLQIIIDSLKSRAGLQLPPNTEIEEVARLEPVISFGLLVAIVVEAYARDIEHIYPDSARVLLLPELLNEYGYGWFLEYPVALEQVALYITNRSDSFYAPIVDRAGGGQTVPDFNAWLVDQCKQSRYPGGVFKVDGGLFVAVPEGLEEYAKLSGKRLDTVKNKLLRKKGYLREDKQYLFDHEGFNGIILELSL